MTNCFSAFQRLYLFIFSILQIASDIYSSDIRLLHISQYHFRHLSNWDLTFVIWHLTSDFCTYRIIISQFSVFDGNAFRNFVYDMLEEWIGQLSTSLFLSIPSTGRGEASLPLADLRQSLSTSPHFGNAKMWGRRQDCKVWGRQKWSHDAPTFVQAPRMWGRR